MKNKPNTQTTASPFHIRLLSSWIHSLLALGAVMPGIALAVNWTTVPKFADPLM